VFSRRKGAIDVRIYEYYCQACQTEMSIWFSSIAQAAVSTPACTACGSENLTRLISSVAITRSGSQTAERHAGLSAPTGGSSDEHPQILARAMHAAAAGRDMGSDFREVAGRLEKGESAAAVEASLRKRVGEGMQPH